MEVAVRIASLSTGITYEVEKKTMSSSIAKKSVTRTSEGLAKPKKEEADEWQLKLLSSVDTHEAQLKEFGMMFQHNQELLKQVLAAVKTGQTVQNSVVPNMRQPRLYNPSQGNPAAASSMTWACFMCKDKSHKISDCPHQKRFVEKGWLVKNAEGKWVLKDGSRIPSTLEEQGKTRKTYVEEYAKTRGWDTESSGHPEAYLFECSEGEDDDDDEVEPSDYVTKEEFMSFMNRLRSVDGKVQVLNRASKSTEGSKN